MFLYRSFSKKNTLTNGDCIILSGVERVLKKIGKMVELSNQVNQVNQVRRVQRELNLKVKLLLPLLMQLNLNLNLKTLDNHSLFRHQNLNQNLSNLHRKQHNQGQHLLNLLSQHSQLNLLSQLSQHNLKKRVRKKIWEHFNLGKMR
jgi:hypothetical protein